ncbi:hypothetical protein ACFCYB_00075 [Streptomyces sp. NPDC056309]|uniref:hypothetical protein n=1 Tax=Streptomyces sp. NPDC056309 TaxID=3345781 RepID=UPI0035DA4690
MPPRKRTTAEPETEDQKPVPANASDDESPADPSAQEGSDAKPVAEDPAPEEPASADPKDDQGGPSRSDLQPVERPCTECMPGGWPEGAFSVGCTHGTWVRKDA